MGVDIFGSQLNECRCDLLIQTTWLAVLTQVTLPLLTGEIN
jgi:hypothetical protein